MRSTVKFEHVLRDHLSDPDQAAKYLTACYEEGSDVFLRALRGVDKSVSFRWRVKCKSQ